jgi:hypothetical protein
MRDEATYLFVDRNKSSLRLEKSNSERIQASGPRAGGIKSGATNAR